MREPGTGRGPDGQRWSADEEDEGDRTKIGWRLFGDLVRAWAPGLSRPAVLAASSFAGLVGFAVLAFSFGLIVPVGPRTPWAGILGLVAVGHAVAWIMEGRVCRLHSALAEFDTPRWVVFFTLLLIPLTVVLGLLKRTAEV